MHKLVSSHYHKTRASISAGALSKFTLKQLINSYNMLEYSAVFIVVQPERCYQHMMDGGTFMKHRFILLQSYKKYCSQQNKTTFFFPFYP